MNSDHWHTICAWYERCHDAIDLMRDDPDSGRVVGESMMEEASRTDDPALLLISQLVMPFFDFYQSRFDEACTEFERIADCFDRLDDSRGVATSLYGLLMIWRARGQMAAAHELGQKRLLPILGTEPTREGQLSLNAMGVVVQELGMTDDAIRYFYASLDMARALALPERIAQVTANIAEIFYASGNAEDAETLLTEAYQIAVKSKERWLAPCVSTLLALCKLSSEKYEEAYQAIADNVKEIETGAVASVSIRAFCLSVAAYTLAMRGDLDQADALSDVAMGLLGQFEDKQLKPYSWWVCGHLLRRRGRIAEAIIALNRAIDELGDIAYVFMALRAMKELAEIHAEQGDWKSAYHEQLRYQSLYARSQNRASRSRLQTLHIQNELKVAEMARRHAEETSKAKSMFLANMSHEIRTPMNAIIGMAHLSLRSEVHPKQRDYIEKIHDAGVSLLGIINDILDFSKIEAGKLDMEKIDFNIDDVVIHASTLTNGKAYEKGLEYLIHIAADIPRGLIGDPLRLGQVLVNLINNAIKFTEAGEIYLSCRQVDRREDGIKLQFMVCDTGIGMTPSQAGKLFHSFSQADMSTTRKYGGTGLGLTISKRLIEMMGGTIWLESEPDVGTAVYFTGWFGVSEKQQPRPAMPSQINGMRVLIVEQNPVMRSIMADGLSALPVKVEMVNNGRAALEAIRRTDRDRPFDVVFADTREQELDGAALINAVHRDLTLDSPPRFVLISPHGIDESHYREKGVRADLVLTKPLHVSMMADAFATLFEKTKKIPAPRLAEALPRFENLSILLVEDNAINQQIAHELMRRVGIDVDIASNGQVALDMIFAAAPGHYGLVLMDIQMPEMDGHEASRAIREDGRFDGLPIVAMTAHAMAADRERSLESGMNDHLTKPVNPMELYRAISRWCSSTIHVTSSTTAPLQPDGSGEPQLVIPGLDVRSGIRRAMDNQAFYLQLLARFREDQFHTVVRIRDAFARGDLSTAERIAHTLKGSAGLVGSSSLQALAGELELAIHRRVKHHVTNSLIERLDVDLNRLLRNLEHLPPSTAMPNKVSQLL